ncbi:MAG: hypothetical protein Kow0029_15920 [Candidatus Rifleibacteriota bacterium]
MYKAQKFIKILSILLFSIFLGAALFAAKISKAEIERLRRVEKLLKTQISQMESEFEASASLSKYRIEYFATVACRNPIPVPDAQMSALLAKAQNVFLGDEHTTAESQKNTIAIMAMMRKNKAPLTLVIEWIDESYQSELDEFLAGKLSLKDLKNKIRFSKNWGFSWANYSKILTAAKRMKVPILLVERLQKPHSLGDRDTYISGKIDSHKAQHENMRYLIVYGEYHLLGPNHLTDKCHKLGIIPDIILVGDAPDTYWKLLEKLEDPDRISFAKLKGIVYYIKNGTPLERSFSYRKYLMKILGWTEADFEDEIHAGDIVPKSASTINFDRLHNPAKR